MRFMVVAGLWKVIIPYFSADIEHYGYIASVVGI